MSAELRMDSLRTDGAEMADGRGERRQRRRVEGGVKRQVRIDVSPDRLQALSVGVDQVIRAVQNENQEIPAGPLTSAGIEQTVQVKGRFQTPDDFKRIIVARRGASNAGHAVTLDQVAQVVDGQEEPDSHADGQRKGPVAPR